jgi:DUF438 domain-containing protein
MIGKITNEIIESLFETIPLEFSIIDHNDKVIAWNKHETRLFKRPEGVLGRDVRDCHPKKSLAMVEKLLDEMKSGKREKARFWINMKSESNNEPQKLLIEYFALRNSENDYQGCMEVTQNITDIRKIKGEKRLMQD